LAPGNYFVTVSTTGGCTETVPFSVNVPALQPCDIEVYNLVTPNGDGNNDRWIIANIELPEYAENAVKVFNRWGNLVWEGRNYDNTSVAFIGRDQNDRKLPEGTYFYEITLPTLKFTGYLTLLQ
jgi:gliding motility-associated-like protein